MIPEKDLEGSTSHPRRNLGLDLVRATEAAAIAGGRWMGLGKAEDADQSAIAAMHETLGNLDIDGRVVVGEARRIDKQSPLDTGEKVGTGNGPSVDVVLDPVDGRSLLAQGRAGAVAVAGIAPRGCMWEAAPAVYMDKIVVDAEVANSLVPECMDAPAAWTLALIARIKKKEVRDLVAFILDRSRHEDLVNEIRKAGARVMLRSEGDIAGALLAASVENDSVDVLMGVGGVAEGVISACAVRALGGAMLGRLAPQDDEEKKAVQEAGLDTKQILACSELISTRDIFFSATGITDGPLLRGVRYRGRRIRTESVLIRGRTGTSRTIRATHHLS